MKRKTALSLLCLMALCVAAQSVRVTSDVVLVDSCAYFPQLSADGSQLLYAPTDAKQLYLLDLKTKTTRLVSDEGVPGFEAIFGRDGKVYYVAMKKNADNLIFRSVRCYDPKRGTDTEVLRPQHGAVHAINGTKGTALVGEQYSLQEKKAGTFAWSRSDKLFIIEKGVTRTLQPVKETVGLLWASVSPDGKKVLFEAAAKGLYICDLQGRIIKKMGMYLMPCWYGNNHIVAMGNAGNVQSAQGARIYLIDANTGDQETLTSDDVAAIQPMVSGDKIVYTTKTGEAHMMTLSLPAK